MKPKLKLACAVGMLCGAVAAGAAEAPKLAVLPTTTEFSGQADLLAAGLSARTNVTLLERDQIQRVWREQELAAGQRPDLVKLGRLLNADGLLSLERRTEGTNELLSVRLIAVKPGVAVAEHRFPLPLAQPTDWGSSYAAQIERLLPKLTVKLADAVPISILNLRASVAGAESVALEEELTALLAFRLTREPAIFVLERRRMEELQAEKESGAADPEPFWNGAYVLDGVVNRDVVSREAVTINARLAPPRGAPVSIEVSGRREALGAVVDDLARKVLASLNKSTTAEAWQPKAEAEAFYQEAVWAWSWGLSRQAAEAADSSWTLGLHTRSVAAHRVAARARLALSMLGPPGFQYVGPYGFRPPPSPEGLTLLARALEIYRDSFGLFAAGTNGPGTAWASAGVNVLLNTARVLDRYLADVELRQGREEALRQVRALAREVNGLLTTNRYLGPDGWRFNLEGLPGNRISTRINPWTYLCEAWLEAGGVWFEKPADAVQAYRWYLEKTNYHTHWFARGTLVLTPIPLAAWSVRDRQELPAVWDDFLREMAASTNLQRRIDGMRLILRHSQNPDELEATAKRFAEEAWKGRLKIFLRDLDAPVEEVLSNLVRRVEPWGRPPTETLRTLGAEWARRFADAGPDLSYDLWKDMVAGLTNRTRRTYSFSPPSVPPRPEQARALLTELDLIERAGLNRWGTMLGACRDHLKAYAGPSGSMVETTKAPAPPASARGSRGVLTISRRWSLENVELPRGREFSWDPRAQNMVWHSNRLWMETITSPAPFNSGNATLALVALNPQSMRSELVETPYRTLVTPPSPRCSLVEGREVLVAGNGELLRRDARGEWHRLPLPEPGRTPWLWGKEIALGAGSSILAIDPTSAQIRVLASSRRNPAASSLDRLPGLGAAQLAVWSGDRLCALVGDRLCAYEPARRDWVTLCAATNRGETLELHAQGAFLRQLGQHGPPFLGGWLPGCGVLEYYSWEPAGRWARSGQAGTFTPPLWFHPPVFHPQESQADFAGPDLWVFPMPVGEARFATNPPLSLLILDRRYRRALELRLALTGSAKDAAETLEAARKGWGLNVEFLPTPGGLAVLIRQRGILLWAPKADIEAAVAELLKQEPQAERLEVRALRRFDRDQNGWLDDAERRAMRHDGAWRKEQQTALNAAIQSAIAQHSAEWDTVFTAADRNRDRKLSAFELAAAVTNQPALFADRLRGVNGALTLAMRPYDLDSDLMFDQAEFRTFLADPRLVAEVNCSVDWVIQFGLKPEQCDTNDDGVLDAHERAQVNRLIRERPGGRTTKGK